MSRTYGRASKMPVFLSWGSCFGFLTAREEVTGETGATAAGAGELLVDVAHLHEVAEELGPGLLLAFHL